MIASHQGSQTEWNRGWTQIYTRLLTLFRGVC